MRTPAVPYIASSEAPTLWSRTIDRPGGRFLTASSVIALAIVVLAIASLSWRRRRRRITQS
ncbi:hypothetical protein NLM27_07010 [Bradyrhizobium sp. CCGB12]|uniref:hypothetical protein n=1 Tax=Bradyrhizobium sp. CCGB12 TaxID=2949632 RepID=UPI0020B2D5E4|nr:hypothetical protein [Bradyrhizobium sp. CCGB12]MCP3388533.1 hypothetical protein [Bradyrhizobium sp. CCGB12]